MTNIKMPFYAVAKGKTVGVHMTWPDCQESVKGFSGAIYKKFDKKIEADLFVESNRETLSIYSNECPKEELFTPDYYVYTDGACSNNGKEYSSAGIGIFFGDDDIRNVSIKIDGGKQTNNVAELTAIRVLYDLIIGDISFGKKIGIVSDSEYAIRCCSSYGERMSRNGWAEKIPNKELVREVYELYCKWNSNVRFIHVRSHTGHKDIHSIGNENADQLATKALLG